MFANIFCYLKHQLHNVDSNIRKKTDKIAAGLIALAKINPEKNKQKLVGFERCLKHIPSNLLTFYIEYFPEDEEDNLEKMMKSICDLFARDYLNNIWDII